MRIRVFHRQKRALSVPSIDSTTDRSDAEATAYARVVIASAVLAYIHRERPGGATIGELVDALGFELVEIEHAIRRLAGENCVRIQGSTVAPYLPRFAKRPEAT